MFKLRATSQGGLCHILCRLSLIPLVLLLIVSTAESQTTSATDGSTPLGLSPGAPSGSYSLSGFESINPYNGNLNFRLPLVGVGGRGGVGMTSMLEVDTKAWTVRHGETTDPNTGLPIDIYTPVPSLWVPKPGYGPGVLVGRRSGLNPNQTCPVPGGGVTRYIYQQTLTRLTFTTSDGTEYEFRDQPIGDQLTGGQPFPVVVSGSCPSGGSRGTVFVTADGSAATFISDATIYDDPQSRHASMIFPSGYLMLRDGTCYRIVNGNVTWIRDRNGNQLTFGYSSTGMTMKDSLNRQVTVTYADFSNTFYDQITFNGFGGATRTILVNYATLGNSLRTTNPRNEPAGRYQLQTYRGLYPELNNGSQYTQWNPWVVSSVTLPNNQQYQLQYNCYAELARVNLPTGGAIEYDYTAGSGAVTDGENYQISRRAKERRLYPDGTNLESYTTYGESSPVTIDHRDANGTLLSREKLYYFGSPADSLFSATGVSYPARSDGREYQSESYANDGTTLLRRAQRSWANRAPVSWWSSPGDPTEPPNDPRVTDSTTTLADVSPNLVSKQTFGYDDSVPYNNRNNVKEYDFGSGSPGALVRETRTTYVTSSNYIDASTGAHIRSLPLQNSIYDAGGIERARITYEYDNYTPDWGSHAALVPRSLISGLCDGSSQNCPGGPNFTDPNYVTRGNVTAITRYLLNSGGAVTGSISTYSQYDVAGNVVKLIDPRSAPSNVIATSIDYSDNFGAPADTVESGGLPTNTAPSELSGLAAYAFPFSITNPLNQKVYTKFDYYLGRPVDAEDANGTTSSGYSDNEPLDRPTKVIRAFNRDTSIKSQTTFSYDDTNRVVTTTSDLNSYGDNLLKSQMVYDGLGRTTEARHYETSANYIAVRQVPFVVLQDGSNWRAASQTSNPFRPYLSEQPVWTTSFFDSLGRGVKVKTPDNSVATTSYSGNSVTVTDQTGKQRQSVSDALGRLVQVYEAPSDPSYNYLTSFGYDALDNLINVTQGTQLTCPPKTSPE